MSTTSADIPVAKLMQTTPARRWFERRAVVLGTALCLTIVIFIARELVSSREEMLGLLYVVPVALTGLELGLRAGVTAALGTLLLVALQPSSSDPGLDALGVATRGVALLSIGAIAGRFSDRTQDAKARMHDHYRSAEHILGAHERERRGIAEQLHEHAAQGMAAALLLVGRVEPHALSHAEQAHLEEVRETVLDCIATLRELAATLRPPVLDELGLVPALERLMESHGRHGGVSIEASDGLPGRLPPDTATLAYRVSEEVVRCMPTTSALRLGLQGGSRVRIAIEATGAQASDDEQLEAALATTRARLKIIGGSMSSRRLGDTRIVTVGIPLRMPPDRPIR